MKKIVWLSGLALLIMASPVYGWQSFKPDYKLVSLLFAPEIVSSHWNSQDCDYWLGQISFGAGKKFGRGWLTELKIGLGPYAEDDGRSKRGFYADGTLGFGRIFRLPVLGFNAKASVFAGLGYLGPRHGWYSVNGSRPLGVYGAGFGPLINIGSKRDLAINLSFKHGSGFSKGDKGFNVLGLEVEYRFP